VRLADVLPLVNSGITNEQFGYGLRSHFDFVITNQNYDPLFSVELDGPLHQTNERQREKDKIRLDQI
jgi:hypothetical protein